MLRDAVGSGGVLPAPMKRDSGDGDTQSSRELAGGGGVLPAPMKRGSHDGDTQSSRELAGGVAGARR